MFNCIENGEIRLEVNGYSGVRGKRVLVVFISNIVQVVRYYVNSPKWCMNIIEALEWVEFEYGMNLRLRP